MRDMLGTGVLRDQDMTYFDAFIAHTEDPLRETGDLDRARAALRRR
ncbi:hypothetical protein [Streptomyces sp. TLI_105]